MEERVSLLAQQVTNMMADVTTLQSELAGSGAQFAELMVRLVTNDPRIKRIVDASEETATIVSRVQALEARSADTATISHMRFRSKEARDFKPNVWTGETTTNESFTTFKMELQNWVGALQDHMLKVMELAETKEGRITEADVRNTGMSEDTIKEMDRRLYQLLVACTKGEARNYVCNTERSGFKACKQMVSHFDPRTGSDRSVAYSRVTNPVSPSGITPTRPKTLQASRTTMQAWEQEVAEFEFKYAKRVDEDAKILALKSIMPETLFGEAGVFPGRSFSTYAELRTSIIRHLDDKVPASMMTKSSSSSVTTSFVQNLIEGERENEEEDKDSITQEDLFVSRISKGSSKGWDTGKSNWNSAKGKGKEWQPYGKWSSTKGKFGSKGKGSIYSVDGIAESDGWTPIIRCKL